MKRKGRKEDFAAIIENALDLGSFISYSQTWGFVEDLERAKEKLDRLCKDDPGRAVALYELFLSGCYDKAEEIDDSDGSLGSFVEELFLAWIQARQAVGYDEEKTVGDILAWIENDGYGFTYQAEKRLVGILNKPAYRLYVSRYEEAFDRAYEQLDDKTPKRIAEYPYEIRKAVISLRDIYVAK